MKFKEFPEFFCIKNIIHSNESRENYEKFSIDVNTKQRNPEMPLNSGSMTKRALEKRKAQEVRLHMRKHRRRRKKKRLLYEQPVALLHSIPIFRAKCVFPAL